MAHKGKKSKKARKNSPPPKPRIPHEPMPMPTDWARRWFLFKFRWKIKYRHRFGMEDREGNNFGWLKNLVGPAFACGGWSVMTDTHYDFSYTLGVALIYVGLGYFLVESLFRVVILRSIATKILAAIFAVIAITSIYLFTLKIVLLNAPLKIAAYAMRNGEYDPGTMIAGIKWDPHFTDLRVVVVNNTDNDYSNIYLNIQPDTASYQASIMGDDRGCHLASMRDAVLIVKSVKDGLTKLTLHHDGDQISFADNAGDSFIPLLHDGYRLECSQLSAHSTLNVVFALAVVDSKKSPMPPSSSSAPPLSYNLKSFPAPLNDLMSILAPRPSTFLVTVDGHYNLGPKRISIESLKVDVGDGN